MERGAGCVGCKRLALQGVNNDCLAASWWVQCVKCVRSPCKQQPACWQAHVLVRQERTTDGCFLCACFVWEEGGDGRLHPSRIPTWRGRGGGGGARCGGGTRGVGQVGPGWHPGLQRAATRSLEHGSPTQPRTDYVLQTSQHPSPPLTLTVAAPITSSIRAASGSAATSGCMPARRVVGLGAAAAESRRAAVARPAWASVPAYGHAPRAAGVSPAAATRLLRLPPRMLAQVSMPDCARRVRVRSLVVCKGRGPSSGTAEGALPARSSCEIQEFVDERASGVSRRWRRREERVATTADGARGFGRIRTGRAAASARVWGVRVSGLAGAPGSCCGGGRFLQAVGELGRPEHRGAAPSLTCATIGRGPCGLQAPARPQIFRDACGAACLLQLRRCRTVAALAACHRRRGRGSRPKEGHARRRARAFMRFMHAAPATAAGGTARQLPHRCRLPLPPPGAAHFAQQFYSAARQCPARGGLTTIPISSP
eukprot:359832-Chlamydomonas_euryale.AAC.8